ncbi:hypothetical protein GCM10027174_12060 [Salinifilum aidingensis]
MNRVVRGSDGREWSIEAHVEWSNPLAPDEFEHDINGGSMPPILMGSALLFLVVLFVLWTPDGVVVPVWLIAALAVLVLFFPVRWIMRRPWQLTASTPGDADEHPPEKWTGSVRGPVNVRQQAAQVARHIELYAEPDMNGELQPVE